MRPTANFDDILKHPSIWRIGQMPVSVKAGISSGHPTLDAVLPSHGWAQAEMTEILTNEQGIGELLLLAPAIRQLTQAGRSVVLIAPPYLPYPMALESIGVALNRIVLILAEGDEQLWATEQAARSGACGLVITWGSHKRKQWSNAALRRLQVAATNGNTALMVYRPADAILEASPAPTRLVVSASEGMLQVKVAKRRGALLAEAISLNLHTPHWRQCSVQHMREVAVLQKTVQAVFQERRGQYQHQSRVVTDKTPVSVLATSQTATHPSSAR